MITRPVFILIILFAVALLMTSLVYGPILRIAKAKNLVDNPDARKLQKTPVPVMGGIAVFFGIVIGLCFFKTTVHYVNLFSTICAMMIMLYVGTIDDISDIRASFKFVIELLVALLVIYGTRNLMSNFQDLFGIGILPLAVAIPLTAVGMVGIINAINMADGVDGLSSGLCICICGVLGLFLFLCHEYSYAALSAVCCGALLPFFFHNVFGRESKMFIGDGGTMMMGMAIASMVIAILKSRGPAYTGFIPDPDRFNFVSFCLATVSVPVFDTLRVMTLRLFRGQSPFKADRTHLHHHFISVGFSHIRITLIEISMNLATVAIWLASYFLGASSWTQFAIVILCGFLETQLPAMICDHRLKNRK